MCFLWRSSVSEPPYTFPAANQGMLLRVRATAFLSGIAIAGAFAVFKLRKDLLDSQEVLLVQVRQPVTHSLSSSRSIRQCREMCCMHCVREKVLCAAVMATCLPSFGGVRAS